mmetsp:Transcript_47293/g.143223  ORF Transcript_47293/g.143223 Transcript_47293/m.143223 type:complete len:381 (-) Transcript_47293:25-1167(-)
MGPKVRAQCPCKRLPIRFSSFTSAEFGDLHSLSRLGSRIVHQVDAGGYTPLHLAAQNNQAAATAYLLSLGADVDGRIGADSSLSTNSDSGSAITLPQCGATPLHRASFSGGIAAMRILLEWTEPDTGRRCDILAKDTSFGDNMTPLHKSVSGGRFLGVQLLLDTLKKRSLLRDGLAALDGQGRTALELAKEIFLRQEEERSSVRRWDALAGGQADWERCVNILEVASMSETAVVSLEISLPRHLSGANTFSCLDCGADDGRCKTASWEAAFRSALANSAEGMEKRAKSIRSAMTSVMLSGKCIVISPGRDNSTDNSTVQTKASSHSLAPPTTSACVSASTSIAIGSKCCQCGMTCLSLFRVKEVGLVCKKCKQRSKMIRN